MVTVVYRRNISLNPYSLGIWIERELKAPSAPWRRRLNPYSLGIWIELYTLIWKSSMDRLNPYSLGIWIEQHNDRSEPRTGNVLILILLEYG